MLRKIKNTEDKKKLLSNFFSLSMLQATVYILPLLTIPYLLRTLGAEKFGLIVLAQSLLLFFNALVEYGFSISATRDISIHRNDKDKITKIFSSIMSIKFILIFVSFIVLTIVVFSFERFSSDWKLYYASFLFVIGNAMIPVWYFQGMENMKYITIVNITSKLLFTGLIFLVIQEPDDYIYVPLINGFGFIVGGIMSLLIVYKVFNQSFVFQKIDTLIESLKNTSSFFFSRLSSMGYSNSNIFLVGILLEAQFTTYYYLADKVISVTLSIFEPVVQTIYPYLSKSFKFLFFAKVLIYTICVSLFSVLIIFLTSDILSMFLLKEINNTFIMTLNILLAIIPISIIYVVLGAPLLLARGYKKEFNRSIIYGFIIHLLILTTLYLYNVFNMGSGYSVIYLFAGSLLLSKLIVMFMRIYYVFINTLYKA
jgi:polysaccharide transporter, PST family